MNISSKLKKIMSFLLVTVLVMSVVVLPVSADTTKQVTYPAGTYPVIILNMNILEIVQYILLMNLCIPGKNLRI